MNRMRMTIVMCLLMAAFVPYHHMFAVSQDTPTYTHFVYMLGHAGWLHWLVNGWSLMVLHNLFRWYRVLASYGCAVGLSYLPLTSLPMLGASVIVCFFIGLIIVYLWRKQRLSAVLTMALLALTCFLPGFAGLVHILAFIVGAAFFQCERFVRDFCKYLDNQ